MSPQSSSAASPVPVAAATVPASPGAKAAPTESETGTPANYGFHRIRSAFKKAAEESRLAFISYIPNGFPKLSISGSVLLTLEKAGCDVVEVGIPFSDPVAGELKNRNSYNRENRNSYSKKNRNSYSKENRNSYSN